VKNLPEDHVLLSDYDDFDDLKQDVTSSLNAQYDVILFPEDSYGGDYNEEVSARQAVVNQRKDPRTPMTERIRDFLSGERDFLRPLHLLTSG
jgi:hypothetical protein